VRQQGRNELALLSGDRLYSAKGAEVIGLDVGHRADLRPHQPERAFRGDPLATYGCGDFDDAELIPGADAPDGSGEGERQIGIAGGLFALELAREHRRHKLFGGCFATAAGHPNGDDAAESCPSVEGGRPEKHSPVDGPEEALPHDTPGLDGQLLSPYDAQRTNDELRGFFLVVCIPNSPLLFSP
jgi:hypothetical protein